MFITKHFYHVCIRRYSVSAATFLGVTVHNVFSFWPPVIKISLSTWLDVCCKSYDLVHQKSVKGYNCHILSSNVVLLQNRTRKLSFIPTNQKKLFFILLICLCFQYL